MSDYKNLTINLYDSPTKFGGGYEPDFQLKGIALQWDSSLSVNENYNRSLQYLGEDVKPSITNIEIGQSYYYESTHFLKNHTYTSTSSYGDINEKITTVWDTAPNPYLPNALPLIVYDIDRNVWYDIRNDTASSYPFGYRLAVSANRILSWYDTIGYIPYYALHVVLFYDENENVVDWGFVQNYIIGLNGPLPVVGTRYFRTNSYLPLEFTLDEEPEESGMSLNVPGFGSPFNTQYAISYPMAKSMASQCNGLVQTSWFEDFINDIALLTGTMQSWNEMLENVVDLMALPFDVPPKCTGDDHKTSIHLMGGPHTAQLDPGWDVINFSSPGAFRIDKTALRLNGCGYYYVARKYNDFRDFAPYTTYEIYIPWVGLKPIDIKQFYGHCLKVEYGFDTITGDGRAFLLRADSLSGTNMIVVEEYPVSFGVHMPVSSNGWLEYNAAELKGVGEVVGGGIAATVGMGMTKMGGKMVETSKYSLSQLEQMNTDTPAQKEQFARSLAQAESVGVKGGKLSNVGSKLTMGGAGVVGHGVHTLNNALANQKTYSGGCQSSMAQWFSDRNVHLIRNEIPTRETTNLINLYGYPSNRSCNIVDINGFAKLSEVKLDIPRATASEKQELEQILKSGVYF